MRLVGSANSVFGSPVWRLRVSASISAALPKSSLRFVLLFNAIESLSVVVMLPTAPSVPVALEVRRCRSSRRSPDVAGADLDVAGG